MVTYHNLQTTVYSISFIILILGIATNPTNAIIIRNKYLREIGIISYGLYIYHVLVMDLVEFVLRKMGILLNGYHDFTILNIILVILLDIAVSYFSYYYVEKWILNYRRYFENGLKA
jgi:peptidoglycan/LPS O-acetylase OafA/YrhL